MNLLKTVEGVSLLNFQGDPGIPLLNFEGVRGSGSQDPGSQDPTFKPCHFHT